MSGRVRRGGFTLIELLVVMAVVGLAASLVPVGIHGLYERIQYRSCVSTIMSALKTARNEAYAYGRSRAVEIDIENRWIRREGGRKTPLPESLDYGLVVAGEEVDGSRGAIRFYPAGGATGGTIVVRRASGAGVEIKVDWLFGRVLKRNLG